MSWVWSVIHYNCFCYSFGAFELLCERVLWVFSTRRAWNFHSVQAHSHQTTSLLRPLTINTLSTRRLAYQNYHSNFLSCRSIYINFLRARQPGALVSCVVPLPSAASSSVHRHVDYVNSSKYRELGSQSSLHAWQDAYEVDTFPLEQVDVSTDINFLSRKHYKETVTVLVGASKQPFVLHKGLLCFYSDFFRAAFEGSFKEATERKIELPDVDIDTFEAFQVWLYSQSFRGINDLADSSQAPKLPSFQILAHLWVFGDKYQIPVLQNGAIDALIQKTLEEQIFGIEIVNIAYENTMAGSPLRRYAIDYCVFRMVHRLGEHSIFQGDNLGNWNTEAFVDFARCMSDAWERKLPMRKMPDNNKCHYHVHADGEHC